LITRIIIDKQASIELKNSIQEQSNDEYEHILHKLFEIVQKAKDIIYEDEDCIAYIPFTALPSSLKYLCLGQHFNQPIEPGALPTSLQVFEVNSKYTQWIRRDTLPPFLKEFRFGYRKFGDCPIIRHPRIEADALPPSLEVLEFQGSIISTPLQLGVLPRNLHVLDISAFRAALDTVLASRLLEHSIEHARFEHRAENVLEKSSRF
jgi:hypothetical protein